MLRAVSISFDTTQIRNLFKFCRFNELTKSRPLQFMDKPKIHYFLNLVRIKFRFHYNYNENYTVLYYESILIQKY